MDNLLSLDRPLNYQDYIKFENLQSVEKTKELDQDSFLTTHKSRLFGEFKPAMQQSTIDGADRHHSDADRHEVLPHVLTTMEHLAELKIHRNTNYGGCHFFYCRKDFQRTIEDELNADPDYIPDGFHVAKGRMLSKEINAKII